MNPVAPDDDVAAAAAAGTPAAHRLLAGRAAVALRSARDVPSPCVAVCRLDEAGGTCVGCLRTLDEIAAWSRLADAGRRAVWQAIARRAATGAATDPGDRP